MDYEKLTHVMRELALVAGDKIMEIYGRDDFEESQSLMTAQSQRPTKRQMLLSQRVCALLFLMCF